MSSEMQVNKSSNQITHKLPRNPKLKHSTSSEIQKRRHSSVDCQQFQLESLIKREEEDTNSDANYQRKKLSKRSDSMQIIRSHSSSKCERIIDQNNLIGQGEVKNQLIIAKVAKELEFKSEECERLKLKLQQKDEEVQVVELKNIENQLLKGDLNYSKSVIKDLKKKLKSVQQTTQQNNSVISAEIQENIMSLIQENEQLYEQNDNLIKECLKYQDQVKKYKSLNQKVVICQSCQKNQSMSAYNKEGLSELNRKIDLLSKSQTEAEKTISDYEEKTKFYKIQIQSLQEKEVKEREQILSEMNKLKQELEFHGNLELKRQEEIEKLIKIIQMKDKIEVEQQKTRMEVEKLHQEIVQKSNEINYQRENIQKSEQNLKNKEDLISHLKNLNEQSTKLMKEEIEKLNREKNLILQESSRFQEYNERLESQLIITKEDLKKVNEILIEKQQQILSQKETFREEKSRDLAELSKIQNQLQNEINNIQHEKELALIEREKYKNEKNKLISENQNIQREYDNIIQQNKLLLNEKQDLILQKQQLQQEKQLLQQDKSQLQQEKQQLQQEKVQMHQDRSTLIRDKQQLLGEKETLLQEKKVLVQDKEQLVSQKKQLTQQNQIFSKEKTICSEENKQLLTKRNEDQQKIKKLTEDLENLQHENNKLIEESFKLSQRQQTVQNQEAQNTQSLSSMHVLKSQYEQLLKEKQSQLEEKIKEISKFKQMLDDKEIELNEANQNLKILQEQHQENILSVDKVKQLTQENQQLEIKLKTIQESVEVFKKKALLSEEQEKTITNLLTENQKLQQNYKQLLNSNQQVHQISSNFLQYSSNSTEETKQAYNNLQITIQQLQERLRVCEALIEEKKKEIEDFKNKSYFPLLEECSNYKSQIAQQKTLIQQLENAFLNREKDFQKQMKMMKQQIEKDRKSQNAISQQTKQTKQKFNEIYSIESSQQIKQSTQESCSNIIQNTCQNQVLQSDMLNTKVLNSQSQDEHDLTNLICKSSIDIQNSDINQPDQYPTCLNLNERMLIKEQESQQNSQLRNHSRENSEKLNERDFTYMNKQNENILDIKYYQQKIASNNSSAQKINQESSTKCSQTMSRTPSYVKISNQDLIREQQIRSSRLQGSSGSLNRKNSNIFNNENNLSYIPIPNNNNNSQKQLQQISKNSSSGKLLNISDNYSSLERIATKQNNINSSRQNSSSRDRNLERNCNHSKQNEELNRKSSKDLANHNQLRHSFEIPSQQGQKQDCQNLQIDQKQNNLISMLKEKVANISLQNKKQPLSQNYQNQSNKQFIQIPKPHNNSTLISYDQYNNSQLDKSQMLNLSRTQANEQNYLSHNSNEKSYKFYDKTMNSTQDENQAPISSQKNFFNNQQLCAPINKRTNSIQFKNDQNNNKNFFSNVSAFDFSQYNK
ncbi:hypothetical protein ABPG74_000539 [Tetrahymena malaccensis]